MSLVCVRPIRFGGLHRSISCHPSGQQLLLGSWLQETPHPRTSQRQHFSQAGGRGWQHLFLWQPPQQRDRQGRSPGAGLQAQRLQCIGRAWKGRLGCRTIVTDYNAGRFRSYQNRYTEVELRSGPRNQPKPRQQFWIRISTVKKKRKK